jgi:hypothetical protein
VELHTKYHHPAHILFQLECHTAIYFLFLRTKRKLLRFIAIAKCYLLHYPQQRQKRIQPPIEWLRGSFPWIKGGRGVTLITHPHVVPRSRMSRSCISSPYCRLHGGSGTPESGSKKCKRRYGEAWRSLRLDWFRNAVRQSVLCWCVWSDSAKMCLHLMWLLCKDML